jgi:hypothetical protein
MKITVDRVKKPEGDLVFTITVSEPHDSCFGEIENTMMRLLDRCKEDVYHTTSEENALKNDVMGLIHAAKEKAFLRVLDNLKFSIRHQLQPKFQPICQEIYNWIYDYQKGDLRTWMIDFDPQRTKYYFDNDPENKPSVPQQSEHEDEDDLDDDFDEDDE